MHNEHCLPPDQVKRCISSSGSRPQVASRPNGLLAWPKAELLDGLPEQLMTREGTVKEEEVIAKVAEEKEEKKLLYEDYITSCNKVSNMHLALVFFV